MIAPSARQLAARIPAWRPTLRLALALSLVLGGVGIPLHAQTTPGSATISPTLLDALNKRGDLTLRNATLAGALFTISELWKINLVVGDEVQGQVNGVFKKAPLHEILDAILLSNGYSYRPVGDSLVVMRLEALGQLNPLFESATIVVEGGNVEEIVASATLFSSPRGEIRAIGSASSVFVLDFPERVALIRDFVSQIDAQSKQSLDGTHGEIGRQSAAISYFAPEFIEPVSAKEAIEAVLSKDGKVAVIDIERKIVVIDYPPYLAQARAVLEQIDVPRPQVRIFALVYDISLQDVEELGFNWNHAVKARYNSDGEPQTLFSLDNIAKVPFQAGATGGTMTFANLSRNFDITAVVRAIQNANDARLLADPNVTVQDNEEATFESITEIPYQQLTQTGQGGQIGSTAFREAGIKLRVKPRIARDGTILMHIEPEFSRLAGFTPEDNQPIIDTRRAMTDVRVANRQTLVLGGLRQRTDTGNFNGVPAFKDLRFFGNLFRARETDVRESELIVFIMPEIIGFDDPPKPRQMAAAETGLCKLNQVPVGEGCYPSGQCGRGAGCSNVESVLPTENGPIEFGPSYGPADGPIDENGLPRPSASDVTIRRDTHGLRQVQRPPRPTQRGVTPGASGSATVFHIPDPPPPQMRTAFDHRYRDVGNGDGTGQRGLRSNGPDSNARDKSTAKQERKGWWQRVLRF